ncbi:DoxX family protein [Agarivorans gilvus]|uniref:Membrane protein n=1 Tax=Agarivorans gilvus TaxID=680279 RepID=A0ABQ1I8B6_9ALTE|nr:DoxX family protein [Agarivorans gilvus]GGB21291.1 membrane protein [Agarivorans gilvus]
MSLLLKLLKQYDNVLDTLLPYLQSLLSISGRFYVSWVFFSSGLTKIADWESTLFLFEYEYSVPLLPITLAALLATVGELVLPVLLTLGVAARVSAVGLFIVNIVAVISLEDLAPAALAAHVIWGLILLHISVWGAGKITGDYLIIRRILRKKQAQLSAV